MGRGRPPDRQPRWWGIAYWTLLLGVVALVPTAATGFTDFLALPADSPAGPTAIRHMGAVLVAGTLFAISLLVRGGAAPPEALGLAPAQLLSAAGVLVLIVGGRLGGALVFRHGVGQTRTSIDQQPSGGDSP